MEMILRGRLTEITPAHITAASPALRVDLVNYLRNRRIEVHHLSEYITARGRNGLVVGKDSLPLREVNCIAGGPDGVAIAGFLDDGCSVVTTCEDLWQECRGASLDPTNRMRQWGSFMTFLLLSDRSHVMFKFKLFGDHPHHCF
jgi:hypothetical protein